MTKRAYILLLLLSLLFTALRFTLQAQQAPVYSQFMMNRFLINPARAGAYGYTAINVTAREQWLGIKNSPKTHAIAFQSRVLRKSYISNDRSPRQKYGKSLLRGGRVGIGGYVFNDRLGAIDRTGGKLTYAYHITFQQSQLSFGVSGSFLQYRLLEDRIKLLEGHESDPLLSKNKNVLYIPDASVGMYYTYPQIFAGISATQLFKSSLKFGDVDKGQYRLHRYYYGILGYKYKIKKDYAIEPSVLFKSNENLHAQLDVNVRFYYKRDYWGGLSFRTGDIYRNIGSAVVVMGGVSVGKLIFGYAFDYTLNTVQRHSYGSHELTAAVKFGDSPRRYRWLRRY